MRASVLLLPLALALAHATTVLHFYTTGDVERLRAALIRPYSSLEEAFHAATGLAALGEQLPDEQSACEFINAELDPSDVHSVYYAARTSKVLSDCELSVSNETREGLLALISEDATVAEVAHAVGALVALDLPLSSQQAVTALAVALAREDSPPATIQALLAASYLSQQADLNRIYQEVEDLVARADEHGGLYLQFEEGLEVTGRFVHAAYSLAEHMGTAPNIKPNQVVQLSNAVLGRSSLATLAQASSVALAAAKLSNNRFHVPLVVQPDGASALSHKQPTLRLRITDVLSRPIHGTVVILEKAREAASRRSVLSQVAFTEQGDVHEFDFLQANPNSGYFDLSLVVEGDARLLGKETELKIKFATEVGVANVEIAIVDKDQSITTKTTSVAYPHKATTTFTADGHQNFVLTFQLIDLHSGADLSPHQVFVRLQHERSAQEVLFVAEADARHVYRFELDVLERRAELASVAGAYAVHLLVGDAAIYNPVHWLLADVLVKFPEEESPAAAKSQSLFMPKPEINHLFREPEKRPSLVVSNAFTALVLAPLLLLLILWVKLGANISNFTFSPSTLLFHLGYAGMLGLMFVFWTQLNMFQTLKYLLVLGIITFLTGNRVLARMAAKRISHEHLSRMARFRSASGTGGVRLNKSKLH
ncbi:dolichyl-diphosphooligosaccharide--protein glycosyltransferase subunit 2 isoform X1 [Petromyzon marinus]|uniref:Dolichyl-diphosphooligosaccharide--protein glycosyltransferase subunit 2 n=1 Tax=Petromyzon marinus TaxID=7757 RepID=A0AAJ7TGN9_PETMA|nr:dolichyl-diphosphooligosaccharide--protein glycosyltransferase subunit 2 isoform X1 [Petromyzon marinus]